jgi:hypothetical protein
MLQPGTFVWGRISIGCRVHAVICDERGMSDLDVSEKGWNHDNHARPFGPGVFYLPEKEEEA